MYTHAYSYRIYCKSFEVENFNDRQNEAEKLSWLDVSLICM